MAKLPPQFELNIEKVVETGEGLGFLEREMPDGKTDRRPVFVYGVFPGEKVLVRPIKVSRKNSKGELLEVLEPSENRRKEKEDHYPSCSPWQTLDESEQLKLKIDLAIEAFRFHDLDLKIEPEIVASPVSWNYRNKIEFSFTESEEGKLKLAFHQRGKFNRFHELESCALAPEKMNEMAKRILSDLNDAGIKKEQLKNLMLRYSYSEDKCLAVLYVVDENMDFKSPDLNMVIYSDPQSPITKTTEILKKNGDDFLTEEINGTKLKFYYDSFFQVCPPAFEKLITWLKKNIKAGEHLVDLYAGVGTIGFCLADKFETVFSLEYDQRASEAALDNVELNNLSNVEFIAREAEKGSLESALKKATTLIIDPPRSGLHPKVSKEIVQFGPDQFIYISCNPKTQARDLTELNEAYKVKEWKLFDFYPQTPHVESVLVLERK